MGTLSDDVTGKMSLGMAPDEKDGEGCCAPEDLLRGLGLLQEKWVLLIVHHLLQGPNGFNQLSRKANGINPTTMSQRLEKLEHCGLVTKTVHSTMPPRTSYELTDAGRSLKPVLDAIEDWSRDNMASVGAAEKCPKMGD